jgi:hypothetical protein
MLNYSKLMALQPTVYKTFTNSIGQTIKLVEHPLKGDECAIIVVCDELSLAAVSDFYELGEIDHVYGEYEVGFFSNELYHGLH